MGNNVAIGIKHIMQQHPDVIKRVAIVDIDVHHGNGTEEIFATDENVLFTSIHQAFIAADGSNEYPGTGMELHTDTTRYNNVNVPINPKTHNRKDYMEKFEKYIITAIDGFRPDVIVISCGMDAHEKDLIGHLCLTTPDYTKITKTLGKMAKKHCDGRLVSVLEGGYNVPVIGKVAQRHVMTLCELSDPSTAVVKKKKTIDYSLMYFSPRATRSTRGANNDKKDVKATK